MSQRNILLVVALMVIGVFSRLIPHMPNFTPFEGVTIFGAVYLMDRKWSIITPIILILVSDFILNNTILRSYFPDVTGIVWFAPYMIATILSIIAIVALIKYIDAPRTPVMMLGYVLISSIIFFLVTNFGSWVEGALPYSRDLSGLMQSYIAALPFYRSSLISTLLTTGVLYGAYELIQILTAEKADLNNVK
jgi:hypothetical protein